MGWPGQVIGGPGSWGSPENGPLKNPAIFRGRVPGREAEQTPAVEGVLHRKPSEASPGCHDHQAWSRGHAVPMGERKPAVHPPPKKRTVRPEYARCRT